MAGSSNSVKLSFFGDSKPLQKAAEDGEKSVGSLEGTIEGLEGAFGKASAAATAMGTALASAGIGVALKALEGVSALASGLVDTQAATGKLQAQLGLTADEAAKLSGVAKEVWKDNWGENINDVTESIGVLRRNLGDMSDETTKQLTEAAIIVRDTFGASVDETSRTVKVLQSNFEGLSATDAFDLITTGFQQGGDFSGELLDTLREYAPQFKQMGFTADQFLGILIEGSKSGAFNLDKVGDAIKELNIRTKDGSATTATAFKALGFDANKLSADFAAGGEKAQSAFAATAAALAGIQDPLKRNQIGVALFGTQWEDLGGDVVAAMAQGTKGLTGFQGATEKAGAALGDNLGSQWQQVQRIIISALSGPLAAGLQRVTEYVKTMTPRITELAESFGRKLGPTLEFVGRLIERVGPPLVRFAQGIISGGKAVYEATQAFIQGKTTLAEYIGGLEIFAKAVFGNFGSIAQKLGPILGNILGVVGAFVKDAAPQIGAQLSIWAHKFADWVQDSALPWLGEKLVLIGGAIADWVKDTGAPAAAEAALALAHALADWVQDSAIPWLQKNVPIYLAWLADWLQNTVIPSLVENGQKLGRAITDWIVDDAIPFLQRNVPVWLAALVDWLRDTALPAVVKGLNALGQAFGTFINDVAIPYLKINLPIWLKELGDWLRDTAAPAVLEAAKTIGGAMVDGIIAGLRAAWNKIKAELTKLAEKLPEPVQHALGIQSPSKVFAEKVGAPIVHGIIEGIRGQGDNLDRVLGGVVGMPSVDSGAGGGGGSYSGPAASFGGALPKATGTPVVITQHITITAGDIGNAAHRKELTQQFGEAARRGWDDVVRGGPPQMSY